MFNIGDKVQVGGVEGTVSSEVFTISRVDPQYLDSHYDMRTFGSAYKVRFADGSERTCRFDRIRRA